MPRLGVPTIPRDAVGVPPSGADARVLPLRERREHRDPTLMQEGVRLGQGRFELLEPLGEGGMGKVWKAQHLGLGRHVALKVLHRQVQAIEDHRKRFEREAKALGRLQHPGIVQALDFGEMEGGRAFLAMEYVEGRTLAAIVKGGRALPWQRALTLGVEVADALAYAHERGVLHRDLKPDNLMVEGGEEDQGRVRLLDLGLARIVRGDDRPNVASLVTEKYMAMGTPTYSAPEQLRGEGSDERSDLYALGAVLFRILAGSAPYPGQSLEEVELGQRKGPPPSLDRRAPDPTRPRAVDRLLQRLLQNAPDDRPDSAAAVAEELRALLDAPSTSPRWAPIAVGLTTTALLAAALTAWFLLG